MDKTRVFTASRLTAGNFPFPTRIEVSLERVAQIRPSFVGMEEESIAMSKVASVSIKTGFLWSQVRIDSNGGSHPILSSGHRNADANAIRDLIELYQKESSKVV
jgi:hypothetical protein